MLERRVAKASVKNVQALSRARGWFHCHVDADRDLSRAAGGGEIVTPKSWSCASPKCQANNSLLLHRTDGGFAHQTACPFESLSLIYVRISNHMAPRNEEKAAVAALPTLTCSYSLALQR